MSVKNSVIFSIIILVYNEEKTIGNLIDQVVNAVINYKNEIIIVDSESTDKTALIIKQKKKKNTNIKYRRIKKEWFNFGKARNFSVKLSRGKFVCFISGDTILENLFVFQYFYEDLTNFDKAVAVFGKQIPRHETCFFSRLETISRFGRLDKYLNKKGLALQNKSKLNTYTKNGEEFLIYFMSNVFACYRKSFLVENKFDEINYGEDILLGKKIIDSNLVKIYDSRCVIYHSQSYSIFEYYKLQLNEFLFWKQRANLSVRSNIRWKITYILVSNMSFLKKIVYLLIVFFYYFIKMIAFFRSWIINYGKRKN